jgi:hypothetical protein
LIRRSQAEGGRLGDASDSELHAAFRASEGYDLTLEGSKIWLVRTALGLSRRRGSSTTEGLVQKLGRLLRESTETDDPLVDAPTPSVYQAFGRRYGEDLPDHYISQIKIMQAALGRQRRK